MYVARAQLPPAQSNVHSLFTNKRETRLPTSSTSMKGVNFKSCATFISLAALIYGLLIINAKDDYTSHQAKEQLARAL